jgi:N-acetylmuramoyl-L-alanine amidase
MGLARSKGNLEIAKQENSVILLEKDYKQTYKGFDPKTRDLID